MRGGVSANWIDEDGVREIGSPEWNAWSEWNEELQAAMILSGIVISLHFLLDEPTKFLPQKCEVCRHWTEIKEQLVGQAWEETQ